MSQSLPNHQQGGAVPIGAIKQANIPINTGGIISGDIDEYGRLRQHTRSSHSESQSSGPEEESLSISVEGKGSYSHSPILQGMQAEGIWYHQSSYEHAESNYQRWLAANSSGPQSTSPRSPGARGYLSFQARRTRGPQQNQGQPVTTVKASGIPHRQYVRGRSRTTSETEPGNKGSRGPIQRRRVFSETDSRDNKNMSGLQCLASENIWFDKHRYDDAEKRFYEGANGPSTQQQQVQVKTAVQQAKGRQQKRQHRNSSSHARGEQELVARMKSLEKENQTLHRVVGDMRATLLKLESRVAMLEKSPAPAAVPCTKTPPVQAAPVKRVEKADVDDDDDDIDLFGSDDEDEETARIKQERLDAYAAKKAKKPTLIAKSSILLDVKPWDDETDMKKLEECVRSVQMDGLLWGASKLLPVGYGIKKLQINCVVEDDKVGTDILEEEITKFEDYVQSVDVAAFNKI